MTDKKIFLTKAVEEFLDRIGRTENINMSYWKKVWKSDYAKKVKKK